MKREKKLRCSLCVYKVEAGDASTDDLYKFIHTNTPKNKKARQKVEHTTRLDNGGVGGDDDDGNGSAYVIS